MATKAFSGQGTVLKRGNGASVEVFTSIGEVKSIAGPTGSANTLDATHLESTGKEYVMGLPDGGEIRVTQNYDPTSVQQQGCHADWSNRTKKNWELILPDTGAAKHAFSAFITNYELNIGVDAIVDVSLTLKLTGLPVFTP